MNIYCKCPWLTLYYNYDLHIETPCKNCNINIETMRFNFLNNIIPDCCKNCNLKSEYNNNKYDEIFNNNIKNNSYKIIEFSGKLTKYCNLKCRTCFSDGPEHFYFFDLLKKYDISELNILTINGGEIMLFNKYLIKLLDSINNKNCKITISTSLFKIEETLINKLKDFTNITFEIGISGIHDIYDYQQPNIKFRNLINNILKLNNKIKIIFQYGINYFNIFSFIDDAYYLYTLFKKRNIKFSFFILETPIYFSVENLNNNKKNKAINYIENNPKFEAIKKINNFDCIDILYQKLLNTNFKNIDIEKILNDYDNKNNIKTNKFNKEMV